MKTAPLLVLLLCAGCATPMIQREQDRQTAKAMIRHVQSNTEDAGTLAKVLAPSAALSLVRQFAAEGTLGGLLLALGGKVALRRHMQKNGRSK
jgi:hypothetical protein